METIAVITNYEVFQGCLRPTEIEHGFGNSKLGWELYYGFKNSNCVAIDTESRWDAWMEYLKHFKVYDQFIPEDSYLRQRAGVSPLEFQQKMVEISKKFGTFNNGKTLPVYFLGMIEEMGEISEVLQRITLQGSGLLALEGILEVSRNIGSVSGIVKRIIRGDSSPDVNDELSTELRKLTSRSRILASSLLAETVEEILIPPAPIDDRTREELTKEYADYIVYLVLAADAQEINFQAILDAGVNKLEKRIKNDSLLGSGSDR